MNTLKYLIPILITTMLSMCYNVKSQSTWEEYLSNIPDWQIDKASQYMDSVAKNCNLILEGILLPSTLDTMTNGVIYCIRTFKPSHVYRDSSFVAGKEIKYIIKSLYDDEWAMNGDLGGALYSEPSYRPCIAFLDQIDTNYVPAEIRSTEAEIYVELANQYAGIGMMFAQNMYEQDYDFEGGFGALVFQTQSNFDQYIKNYTKITLPK